MKRNFFYISILTVLVILFTSITPSQAQLPKTTRICIVNLCEYGTTFTNRVVSGTDENTISESVLGSESKSRSAMVTGITRNTSSNETPGEPFDDYIYAINETLYKKTFYDDVSSFIQTETAKIILDSLGYAAFTENKESMEALRKDYSDETALLKKVAATHNASIILVLRTNRIDMDVDALSKGKGRDRSNTGKMSLTASNKWEMYNAATMKKIDEAPIEETVVLEWADVKKANKSEIPVPTDVLFFVNAKAAQAFTSLIAQ